MIVPMQITMHVENAMDAAVIAVSVDMVKIWILSHCWIMIISLGLFVLVLYPI